jgi:transcriptional regulator GlxA family with amidase domain
VAPAVPEQAAAPAVPGSAAEPAVPAEAPAGGPGLAGRIDAVLRLPRGEEPAPMALAKRAVIHVRAHLEEGHTVAGLADVLHVSPRTLERGLKDALGCTPRELILALRMGEARRLLETGALRVNEVGYRVGFDSPEHFSRRFREFHGIAPSAVARKPRPAGR